MGGPKWDNPKATVRPEQALFKLRGALGLFANLRPVTVHPTIAAAAAPVRAELLEGVDLLIVRELTGGLYYGERTEASGAPGERWAVDTLPYSEPEIQRVVRLAFELARGRRGHLTSVDKANVLATSRLWRTIVEEMRPEFPDVEVSHQLVDSCAMLLIKQPARFDVLVTENLFGDILSDEAGVLAGSLGMLPSASLGERRTAHGTFGLFEPIHGSAPDIAGQDRANPIGTILSAAMLLRLSLGRADAADAVEGAVTAVLDAGYRTGDLAGAGGPTGFRWWAPPPSPVPSSISSRPAPRKGAGMTAPTPGDAPVVLYDTTLRDGTQGENITLSLADKLRIARMLDEFGMPFIEGGWPGSNPKDIEFFATARTMRWERARLAAFGSTRHRSNKPGDDPNLRELVAAETPVVTIFGKSWLLHVTEVLGATPAENLDMIADSVGFIVDRGREAIYDAEHFFDGYKADRDYAFETLRAARGAGARTLVLCDTNGGTMTDELVRIIGDVRGTLEADPDAPAVTWGIHTHNDAELAVANSMAAVTAGIRHVQATINGYGERAGNANMVSILANLALKTPHALVPAGGGDLPGLTELSRSIAEIANVTPNDYQPYVGRSAFAHKGGVHGAAVAKVERSYQHIDPTAVGNAGRLVVSELGGRANISIRAEQLGHELEGVVDPRELSKLIKQLEADGLAFEGRRGELRAAHPAPFGGLRRRRSGSSTTPAWSNSATAASCWPRRRSRSRWTARSCTRPATATGRSTPSTWRCARRCAPSTRGSTRSTWWTTRSGSSTASRRRPHGPG